MLILYLYPFTYTLRCSYLQYLYKQTGQTLTLLAILALSFLFFFYNFFLLFFFTYKTLLGKLILPKMRYTGIQAFQSDYHDQLPSWNC